MQTQTAQRADKLDKLLGIRRTRVSVFICLDFLHRMCSVVPIGTSAPGYWEKMLINWINLFPIRGEYFKIDRCFILCA